MSRTANKSPVRGAVRGSRLRSFQAYHRIFDFLTRRCRAFSVRVDRAFIDGRLRLPAHLNVQTDARVYPLNWISRMDRRNGVIRHLGAKCGPCYSATHRFQSLW